MIASLKYCFKVCVFVGLLVFPLELISQDKPVSWFPEKPLFPFLEYDLLEVQPYVGVFSLQTSDADYMGAYIPITFGFRKALISWDFASTNFDFTLGTAAYPQFEIIQFDENTLRGGLLNTDYRIMGAINASRMNQKLRIQIFHISSHLGDDYMLRNPDFVSNDKSVNYEQLDITYMYSFANISVYGGLGQVIGPNAYRKRSMVELGFQGMRKLNEGRLFTYGSDLKFYSENNMLPDIHSAIGITFAKQDVNQLNISLDTYTGNLPYSTLDYGRVFWLGISSKIFL